MKKKKKDQTYRFKSLIKLLHKNNFKVIFRPFLAEMLYVVLWKRVG